MKTLIPPGVSNQVAEAGKLISEQTRSLQALLGPALDNVGKALANWHSHTLKQVHDLLPGANFAGPPQGVDPADIFPYATAKVNPTDN
ncbi:hypothetical protein [Larkinella sp. C7]|uniref:hypothetical protein n=1 Tax=Larkinella sp. C7 TaxID=2576607 RepID=UPI0011114266|nr:hypothetical protein [Larkinella sp. C7]